MFFIHWRMSDYKNSQTSSSSLADGKGSFTRSDFIGGTTKRNGKNDSIHIIENLQLYPEPVLTGLSPGMVQFQTV